MSEREPHKKDDSSIEVEVTSSHTQDIAFPSNLVPPLGKDEKEVIKSAVSPIDTDLLGAMVENNIFSPDIEESIIEYIQDSQDSEPPSSNK